jgi:uncharacterized protein (TIGR03000 family)
LGYYSSSPDLVYPYAPSYYGSTYSSSPDLIYAYPPTYNAPATVTNDHFSAPQQPVQYGSLTTASSGGNAARVTVRVPPDAQIWVENQATKLTGGVRNFVSPRLTPGREYIYDIRAVWQQDGHAVEQARQVAVHAGAKITVDFTQPTAVQPAASPTSGSAGS